MNNEKRGKIDMCVEEYDGHEYEEICDCDENKQLALDIMEILVDIDAVKFEGNNAENVETFMNLYNRVYDRLEDITCVCEKIEDEEE